VGEVDPRYENFASEQAVKAAAQAWLKRQPARLRSGQSRLNELSYNRTRAAGVIDPTLTVASFETTEGHPFAVLVNFGAHPTVTTAWRPFAVSRDVPGLVCDLVEEQLPGSVCMYLQGACGDVNFRSENVCEERHREPAIAIVAAAVQALDRGLVDGPDFVGFATEMAELPTRRWTRDEIESDRNEAVRRLLNEDFAGWREGFGRSMTNCPEDMIKRHGGDEAKAVRAMCRFHLEWTDKMLFDFETRPEALLTEVQAIRMGDLVVAAHAAELFSPFALDLRSRFRGDSMMIASYSNGRIGYVPDEHDILLRSYAGYQSPKYCNQFPFTARSGPALCDALAKVIEESRMPNRKQAAVR
jgi:neutral ceramidase